MYEQVYFHPVRRIYDIHLKEFMLAYFGKEKYPTKLDGHLATTDNEILAAMAVAANDQRHSGHGSAKLIVERTHFRKVYSRAPVSGETDLDDGARLFEAVKAKFGEENVRFDSYRQKSNPTDFPVLLDGNSIKSSLALSEVLVRIPLTAVDFIFCEQSKAEEAREWLAANQLSILRRE